MIELDDRLTALAESLHLPATVDVEAIFRGSPRAAAPEPFRSRWPWRVAAIAAASLVVVLALPSTRSTVARWLGLSSTRIEPVTSSLPQATFPPPTSRPPDLPAATAEAIRSAEQAAGVAAFVPALLGTPDAVEVAHPPGAGQVVLTFAPSDLLPATRVGGVGALVSTFAAALDDGVFGKFSVGGTVVREVDVDGVTGYWLEGEPHAYAFIDSSGDVVPDTLRLATNTLLWERDGTTYRIEADVELAVALSIATGGSLPT